MSMRTGFCQRCAHHMKDAWASLAAAHPQTIAAAAFKASPFDP